MRETVAAAAIRLLEAYGITTVFGIPGVHTLEYYRALSGSGLRVVLARHEQGAAFMADGYARACGRPAVVCVITGPGLTNAATGIGQAFSDSVPMLVLTAMNPAERHGRGGRLHDLHSQPLVAQGLTDNAFVVTDPDSLAGALAEAFASFRAERPRPAIVAVPLDVLTAPVESEVEPRTCPAPPAPPATTLAAVASMLRSARRPAVILGGGSAAAGPNLRHLVQRLGAPVITTIAGKGVIPSSSPLYAGSCLPLASTRAWLAQRDVLLAIGTELAATDTEVAEPIFEGSLIRVDIDRTRFDDLHPATVAVHADAGRFAEELLPALESGWMAGSRNVDGPPPERARWVRDSHLTALAALRKGTDASTRFVSDMTQLAYTGNIHFPVEEPRTWLHPAGFGALGYALPAAIGAAIADPRRRVVAILGDSGFLYTGQELATAVELSLPVTAVVWNNQALGQIRDDMVRTGIRPSSVHPHNGDLQALARAYGCPAERVDEPELLGDAVRRAADREGPALVEVLVDERAPAGGPPK